MKWSWKIARIAGIDIYVHATFLFLIYLVGITYWNQQGTLAAVISGVAFVLSLFLCVVLHEFGHSLTARRYGIQTRHITLLPIGGVASLEKMPDDPRQEINVALAGPAVNFLIATLLYLYLDFRDAPITNEEVGGVGGSFVYSLMWVNVFIGSFNLLPAFPMDGGRVLRAMLATRMDHATATRKAAAVGQFIAIGIGYLGIMYNPYLLLIAIFIWFGAAMESNAEQVQSVLQHARVRHAMLSEFHSLSPEDTLAQAVKLTLAGSQKDFPVGYQGRLEKVLRHEDLLKGLQERGENARICELNLQNILSADIDEPLVNLLARIKGNPAQMICVIDRGEIAGLVNLEHVLELMRIQEAIANHQVIGKR